MKALTLLELCIGDGGCDGIRIRMPVTGDIYFFLVQHKLLLFYYIHP